jgi:hypothetical protein
MDMRRRWGMHDGVSLALSWDVVPDQGGELLCFLHGQVCTYIHTVQDVG